MCGFIAINKKYIESAEKLGGTSELNKRFESIETCLFTIKILIGKEMKLATTKLMSINLMPNHIVAPATNIFEIKLSSVNLKASFVFPLAIKRFGKNQATTPGNMVNADIAINSALGANLSPNAIVTNGSATAASPIKIGNTSNAVIVTIFIKRFPKSSLFLTLEKLGTTIEFMELMVT